jgi:GDPmannose 4,6-dehydratase
MIKYGLANKLKLGNLEAKRDWGYAKDYIYAMWLMLQQDEPDDYVIATGETHSVEEVLRIAFERVELDYEKYVEISEEFYRPAEVKYLLGDARKAREKLGWRPSISLKELIHIMVDSDLRSIENRGYRMKKASMFSNPMSRILQTQGV